MDDAHRKIEIYKLLWLRASEICLVSLRSRRWFPNWFGVANTVALLSNVICSKSSALILRASTVDISNQQNQSLISAWQQVANRSLKWRYCWSPFMTVKGRIKRFERQDRFRWFFEVGWLNDYLQVLYRKFGTEGPESELRWKFHHETVCMVHTKRIAVKGFY